MDIFNWLEKRGIAYYDKNLIQRAFIHSSYVNENPHIKNDNERLEFIGDAVLQLWTSQRLYELEPALNEGKMTTYRAAIVCEEALVGYVNQLDLSRYLLLGQGEEKNGGRFRDSILADMMEAFLGAIYLDSGYDSVDQVLKEVISFTSEKEIEPAIFDYKTKLQEYIQGDIRKSVHYEVIETSGPSNNPLFKVNALMDDIILGSGQGYSKKKAEQDAAKDAFRKMVK